MRAIKISQTITNRDIDSLTRYFQDISKYPLLKAEDETLLARKIKKGDEEAFQRLVNANLRFVVSVAKKYEGMGVDFADLISEGNAGLVKAARRYDETKGFKFISFAVWWIRQAIISAIGEYKRSIRLPMNQVNGIIDLTKAEIKLEQTLERSATPEELAEFTGLSCERVIDYQHNSSSILSIHTPAEDQEEGWVIAIKPDNMFMQPDANLEKASLSHHINTLFHPLSDREKKILNYSYGLNGFTPMDNEHIGNRLGLSSETVRKYKALALATLRKTSLIDTLKIPE